MGSKVKIHFDQIPTVAISSTEATKQEKINGIKAKGEAAQNEVMQSPVANSSSGSRDSISSHPTTATVWSEGEVTSHEDIVQSLRQVEVYGTLSEALEGKEKEKLIKASKQLKEEIDSAFPISASTGMGVSPHRSPQMPSAPQTLESTRHPRPPTTPSPRAGKVVKTDQISPVVSASRATQLQQLINNVTVRELLFGYKGINIGTIELFAYVKQQLADPASSDAINNKLIDFTNEWLKVRVYSGDLKNSAVQKLLNEISELRPANIPNEKMAEMKTNLVGALAQVDAPPAMAKQLSEKAPDLDRLISHATSTYNPLSYNRAVNIFAREMHLAFMEHMNQISAEELLVYKSDRPERAPHISAMIEHIDNLSCWVTEHILSKTDLKERNATIKFMLDVAGKCESRGDMATGSAIISAMNKASVGRLNGIKKVRSKMGKLTEDFNMIGNYKALRAIIAKKEEKKRPVVPLPVLFTKDISILAEVPNTVGDHSNPKQDDPLNFEKCKTVAHIVERFHHNIERIRTEIPQYGHILKLRTAKEGNIFEHKYDEGQQYQRSLELEKRVPKKTS